MTTSGINTALSLLAFIVSVIVALSVVRDSYRTSRESRRVAVMDILQLVEATRPDRYKIRAAQLPQKSGELELIAWEEVGPETKDCFDRVARVYDIMGALDRLNLISHELTDVFYSTSCYELWVKHGLGSYVDWKRQQQPFIYWELVEFHNRTMYVWENHPANSGAPKWPRNPRKQYVNKTITWHLSRNSRNTRPSRLG